MIAARWLQIEKCYKSCECKTLWMKEGKKVFQVLLQQSIRSSNMNQFSLHSTWQWMNANKLNYMEIRYLFWLRDRCQSHKNRRDEEEVCQDSIHWEPPLPSVLMLDLWRLQKLQSATRIFRIKQEILSHISSGDILCTYKAAAASSSSSSLLLLFCKLSQNDDVMPCAWCGVHIFSQKFAKFTWNPRPEYLSWQVS